MFATLYRFFIVRARVSIIVAWFHCGVTLTNNETTSLSRLFCLLLYRESIRYVTVSFPQLQRSAQFTRYIPVRDSEYALTSSASSFVLTYVLCKAHEADFAHVRIDKFMSNQLMHGNMFILGNAMSHFSFQTPLNGCPGMIRTSVTSKGNSLVLSLFNAPHLAHAAGVLCTALQCLAATNAGFFDMLTGACLGDLIVEGRSVQLNPTQGVHFGLRADTHEFAVGYLEPSDVQRMQWRTLIQGNGWLVRNGSVYIDTAAKIEGLSYDALYTQVRVGVCLSVCLSVCLFCDAFNHCFVPTLTDRTSVSPLAWLQAPRTAVGHDAQGNLVLAQVDGQEQVRAGPTFYDWAQLLVELGLVNAINLDGTRACVRVCLFACLLCVVVCVAQAAAVRRLY